MRPLPSDRKSAPVTQAAIRTDFHKSFDVQGNGFAQIPFHHAIPLDYVPDAHRFVFRQVFHLGIDINSCFLADLSGSAFANTVNVGQTYLDPFVQRQIHARYSSQFLPPS